MATRVGALFADLRLNASKWSTGLKKASNDARGFNARTNRALNSVQRKLDQTGRSFGKLARRTLSLRSAVATLAGAGGLGLLAKRSLETANNLALTADKIGVTTDELQELRFAADKVGVSQQTLDLALQRFSRRVGEARKGTGELAGTLKEYGIELRNADGSSKSLTDILGQLSDAAKKTGDSSEQLRIAFKAFDSEGAALVNILREGSDALAAMRAEAHEMGVVIDEDVIRKAADANTKLGVLSTVISANLTTALVELAPILVGFAEHMADAARFVSRVTQNIKNLSTETANLSGLYKKENEVREELNEKLRERLRIEGLISKGQQSRPAGELELFRNAVKLLDDQIAELQAELKPIQDRITALTAPPSTEVTVFAPMIKDAKTLAAELLKLRQEQDKYFNSVAKTSGLRFPKVDTPSRPAPDTPGAPITLGAGIDPVELQTAADSRLQSIGRENELIRAGIAGNDELIARLRIRNEIGILPPGVEQSLVDATLETQRLRDASATVGTVMAGVGDAIGTAFADLTTRAKSAQDVLKSLFLSLSRLGTQQFLQQGVSSLFQQNAGGSSGFGSIATALAQGLSTRAAGGPVQANKPFLVGEQGAELFVPRTSGQVVPNAGANGGGFGFGAGVTVNNFVSANDVDGFNASLPQLSANTFRDISRESGRIN